MTFLLRTLRDWFVTLEAIALQKPALYSEKTCVKRTDGHVESQNRQILSESKFTDQLKEASVTEARATPPTMGRSESTTQGVGFYNEGSNKSTHTETSIIDI